MRWMLLLLCVAGCATDGTAGQAARRAPTPAPHTLEQVTLAGVRGGQLSASREWMRADSASTAVARDDALALRAAFVRELSHGVPLVDAAPRRLRVRLTLQDTGYYEGLAAETTDVALTADVYDPSGAHIRSITLREPASAPLQRSRSRRQRLEDAFSRLADRLAAAL
jgi:hypothetical protein